MSHHCRIGASHVNDLFRDQFVRPRISKLWRDNGDAREIVLMLTANLDDEQREILTAEFESLPDTFIPTLMGLWLEAERLELPFEFYAREPESVLASARKGRVTYEIDHDEDGIRMYVEHVHRHHAAWMTEPEAVTA